MRVVDRRWWARGESSDSTDDGAVRKPKVVEDLEQRLAEAAAQLQSVLAEHRRAADEFEQARVRMRRELAREVERGRRAVIVDMLEVLDNLDRAATAARSAESGVAVDLIKGIDLVRAQFLAKLKAYGVAPVAALGLPFDPQLHEAISTASVADVSQSGLVLEVVKEGYAIGDELLRPAAVIVAAASSGTPGV